MATEQLYTYATVENNVVTNVSCAESSWVSGANDIRVDTLEHVPGIGWIYENGNFTDPSPPPPPPTPPAPPEPNSKYTKLQFRNLFEFNELISIDNFQNSSTLTSDQKAVINTINQNFYSTDLVDVKHPLTIQGIDYMVTVGLLTVSRAKEILTPGAANQLV